MDLILSHLRREISFLEGGALVNRPGFIGDCFLCARLRPGIELNRTPTSLRRGSHQGPQYIHQLLDLFLGIEDVGRSPDGV